MTDDENDENDETKYPLARMPTGFDITEVDDTSLTEAFKRVNQLRLLILQEQRTRLEAIHLPTYLRMYDLMAKPPDFLGNREGDEEDEKYFWKNGRRLMKEWRDEIRRLATECKELMDLNGEKGDHLLRGISPIPCNKCDDISLWEYRHERSWQEMPGAPVEPAYHYYVCIECGWRTAKQGNRDETISGVDTTGQPLYAHMTTQEVAEICVCNDPEYGPRDCRNPQCVEDYYS